MSGAAVWAWLVSLPHTGACRYLRHVVLICYLLLCVNNRLAHLRPALARIARGRLVGILLIISAGWTNFGYVQAIIEGEVMRVLLLFYLAPLWTVFFAHFLLGERLNRYGYTVIALSLGGALVMLWQPAWVCPCRKTGLNG